MPVRTDHVAPLLLASALIAGGCQKNPSEPHLPATSPGRFALTRLQGLTPTLARMTMVAPAPSGSQGVDFDLGDIRNTSSFFFILANAGGTPITAVTLTSSNAAFEIAPSSIDSLLPDTGLSFVPVIRLTAVHGTAPSGVGFANLLNPGLNATTVAISGTTKDSAGRAIAVSLNSHMNVNALVMDIRLFDGAAEVDLTHPTNSCLGCAPSDEVVRIFQLNSTPTTLRNSGNVPLDVTIWTSVNGYSFILLVPPHTLAVGASETFTYPVGQPVALELASGGTISDHNRLPLARNGHAFVGLTHS